MKEKDKLRIIYIIVLIFISIFAGMIIQSARVYNSYYTIPKPEYQETPVGMVCVEYKNITWWELQKTYNGEPIGYYQTPQPKDIKYIIVYSTKTVCNKAANGTTLNLDN